MAAIRATLRIDVLGELRVAAAHPLTLPGSRKTRALLAFLLLTGRPQRRDRLCELFWELPDDPRGALRWSLSKLRAVVNDTAAIRLQADRERVWIEAVDLGVDLTDARRIAGDPCAPPAALEAAAVQLRQTLLEGLDLPQHEAFQAWLVSERHEAERLRSTILARLVEHHVGRPDQSIAWCREWAALEPLNPAAASALTHALTRLGKVQEATEVGTRFRETAAAAAIDPPVLATFAPPSGRDLLQRQRIRFCTAPDGMRIAYAMVGDGPHLLKAANWLNHLELDWDAPIWAPMFRELASDAAAPVPVAGGEVAMGASVTVTWELQP